MTTAYFRATPEGNVKQILQSLPAVQTTTVSAGRVFSSAPIPLFFQKMTVI
jgi:hypothetical protein